MIVGLLGGLRSTWWSAQVSFRRSSVSQLRRSRLLLAAAAEAGLTLPPLWGKDVLGTRTQQSISSRSKLSKESFCGQSHMTPRSRKDTKHLTQNTFCSSALGYSLNLATSIWGETLRENYIRELNPETFQPETFQAALRSSRLGIGLRTQLVWKINRASPLISAVATHIWNCFLSVGGRMRKRKWSHCRRRLTFLLLKYWGEGETSGTLNPSPHLGVFSKTNPNAHPHRSGHTYCCSSGGNFHWT